MGSSSLGLLDAAKPPVATTRNLASRPIKSLVPGSLSLLGRPLPLLGSDHSSDPLGPLLPAVS